MLVLGNEDIEKIVSYDKVLNAIEEAYRIYEDNAYYMPDRFHVDYKEKNLLYMPCFLEHVFGTKLLTIFPENNKKGIPSLDGLMLLNDYETGKPTCLMDGKLVTALRTGAVGGLGIRYTTPETVESIGLIGAGAQGFYQALYACRVRNVKTLYVYDIHPHILPSFIDHLQKKVPCNTKIVACDNTTKLVEASEVIITATTSTAPTMPEDASLLRGRHFIGIGSYKPHMREFPDALYPLLDFVCIDADIALEESGDLIQPIESGLLTVEQLIHFSKFIKEPANIAKARQSTTLFKSVGIAIFDIVTADLLYKLAVDTGIGYTM